MGLLGLGGACPGGEGGELTWGELATRGHLDRAIVGEGGEDFLGEGGGEGLIKTNTRRRLLGAVAGEAACLEHRRRCGLGLGVGYRAQGQQDAPKKMPHHGGLFSLVRQDSCPLCLNSQGFEGLGVLPQGFLGEVAVLLDPGIQRVEGSVLGLRGLLVLGEGALLGEVGGD